MRHRTLTTIDVDGIEVELESNPEYFEPITTQPTPDTLVVGYLLQDYDCENPMTSCDCEGKLYTKPSSYGGGTITDDSSAASYLGLEDFSYRGVPTYDLNNDLIEERVAVMLQRLIRQDTGLVSWYTGNLMETGLSPEDLMWDLIVEMGGYRWNTSRLDWSSEEDQEMIARLPSYESLATTAWEDLFDEGKIGEYLAVPVDYCDNNHGPGTASASTTSLDNANAVWVPDECAIENMNFTGCVTHADKMRVAEKYAEGVLKNYINWCNGECYGVVVESFKLEGGQYERVGDTDSCWGFVGQEWAEQALREQMDYAERNFKEEVTA